MLEKHHTDLTLFYYVYSYYKQALANVHTIPGIKTEVISAGFWRLELFIPTLT